MKKRFAIVLAVLLLLALLLPSCADKPDETETGKTEETVKVPEASLESGELPFIPIGAVETEDAAETGKDAPATSSTVKGNTPTTTTKNGDTPTTTTKNGDTPTTTTQSVGVETPPIYFYN